MKSTIIIFFSLITIHVFSQTVFSDDGKYGLIDNKNEIILPAKYDTITKHNKFDEYHLFILQRGNKYSFALKQFWETRTNVGRKTDSIKWFFSDNYDTLYVLNAGLVDRVLPQFISKQDSIKHLVHKRDWYTIAYRDNKKYGIITYEHKRKDIERIHKSGRISAVYDHDYWKSLYSFSNVTVHSPKYDNAILDASYNYKRPTVTQNNGKYGILRMGYGYELIPQFDTIPLRLKEHFFYVKKNGLWGVIFLQEQDSIPLEIIPYKYSNMHQIEGNYKYLTFSVQGGYSYPVCVYASNANVMLQLKFIINRFYIGWGSVRSKHEIANKIKNIIFTPKINGKSLIQEEDYEYVIATNFEYTTESLRKKPTFFVIKFDKSYKDRFSIYHRDFSRFYNSYDEQYVHNGGIKSIFTYQLENNTFILQNEFNEVDNVSYNIMDQTLGWDFACIIKEVILDNDIYKYEFYSFNGKKLYEISSKYSIDNWENSYNTPIVEFYSDIPEEERSKRRKKTRRIVCKYNYEKEKFSK